MKTSLTIVFKN